MYARCAEGKLTPRARRHTDMNVPGKKNSVTSVMIFMETVSVFVLRAMLFISSVISFIWRVESRDSEASVWLLRVFFKSRML